MKLFCYINNKCYVGMENKQVNTMLGELGQKNYITKVISLYDELFLPKPTLDRS